MEIDRDLADNLRDRWAMATKMLTKHYPLIMGVYCYQYFGQNVQIIEANVYDKLENAEVTVEHSGMERTVVEFAELSWNFSFKFRDELSKRCPHDIVTGFFPPPEPEEAP